MRICHVITRLIIGGAQENTLLTCEGLHDHGHDVLLLAGPETGAEGSLWDRATGYGYQVETIPSLRRAVHPLHDLRALRQLIAAYAEFQPQIIHTHSSKAGVLGRLAATSAKSARIVHTIHGMSFNRTQGILIQALYRELECAVAAHTDAFVAVAQAMIEQAVFAGLVTRDHIITVHSGMRTERFTPDAQQRAAMRRAWNIREQEIVVGTVARLFRGKGYEQLIPAAVEAVRGNSALRFVWIGDGTDRLGYERSLSSAGIRDRVTLLGVVAPEKVAETMQGFDLLVHCSQWEGLPRAVVQALLLEVPVVSFDVDGAAEVVLDDETGRLIPLNDLGALRDAILALARDLATRRRLGRNGRRHCLTRFNHHAMVDHLEKLYARLVAVRCGERLVSVM